MPSSRENVRLDEEHRDRLKRCLRRSAADVSDINLVALETAVAGAVRAFLAEASKSAMTYREAHDATRELWQLASEPDPPIGQIRARIKGKGATDAAAPYTARVMARNRRSKARETWH